MIRCSGSCSGRRAALAKRALAGKTAPFAEQERGCCAAFANAAARLIKANCGAFKSITASMKRLCSKFVRYPNGTPIGTARRLKAHDGSSLNDDGPTLASVADEVPQ